MFFNINNVNQGGKQFGVLTASDRTDLFPADGLFQIRGSTGNDGVYTVVSASFSGDTTTITVVEVIPSATVDGVVNGGVYRLGRSNATNPEIIVTPAEINTSSTPLDLVGFGTVSYGQSLLENDIHILENFANDTAPANPLVGQFWFNDQSNTMSYWTGASWVSSSGVDTNNLRFVDPQNGNAELILSGDDAAFADQGITLRPESDPTVGSSLFRIINNTGSELLRVEHNGAISTTNNLEVTNAGGLNYLLSDTVVGASSITADTKFEVVGATRLAGDVGVTGATSLNTLVVSGTATFTSGLSANSNRITNVADPVGDNDVATRSWVLANSGGSDVSSANDLTDVTITSVANDDVLIYNSTNSRWENTNFDNAARESTGNAVVNGTHSGLSATYDAPSRTVRLDVNDPLISLTGAVTGSATMTNLGNVSIATTQGAKDVSTSLATGYTFTLADAGGHKIFDAPTAVNAQVPADSTTNFPVGTEISFRQKGDGIITVVAAGGVTVESPDGDMTLRKKHSRGYLIKEAANLWLLSGDLGPDHIITTTAPTGGDGQDGDIAIVV